MARILFVLLVCFLFQTPAKAADWKTIDLEVLIFSGTSWTHSIVENRILAISKVYAQCDVSIANVSIKTIPPPTGEINLYRDLETKGRGGLRAAAIALGVTSRLTLVLIRQFQEGVAGTAGIPQLYANTIPEMVNRAWVSEELLEPTYLSARDPNYITEAHELAHILLNTAHLPKGTFGLMSGEFDHVNGQLSPAECTTIRASKFAH